MSSFRKLRRSRAGTVLAALVTFAPVLIAGCGGPAAAAVTTHPKWVIGYYAGYQRDLMPPAQIDWTAMTHIAVARLGPRADGTLDTSFDIDNVHGPALARDLAGRARAHGVVPILMVGGAGTHDEFLAAARDHRLAFENHLLAIMRRYGYRGLDLDWEPVEDGDAPTLIRLARDLRAAAPHIVLTVPVGWVTSTFPDVPAYYATLARSVDRLSIMSYGMAGAWDGWRSWHSSALHGAWANGPSAVDLNVGQYRAAGVPARKLNIGIGFYGSCWAGGVTAPRQVIGGSSIVADDNVMSYTNIKKRYYSAGAYRYDTVAQAPYLSFDSPHGPQGCTWVSYENPRSIRAKGAYASAHGLGGMIVWTINQAHVLGAPAGHGDPLLKVARQALGA